MPHKNIALPPDALDSLTRFLSPESGRVLRAYELYRLALNRPGVEGVAARNPSGWRCFITQPARAIAVVDVFRLESKAFAFRLQLGEAPSVWLKQIVLAENRKVLLHPAARLRILEVPVISLELLWINTPDSADTFLDLHAHSLHRPRAPLLSDGELNLRINVAVRKAIKVRDDLKQLIRTRADSGKL